MIPRRLLPQLARDLAEVPAVVLLGPRQVGKTTLARTLADQRERSVYIDLERPSDRARLQDADAYLRSCFGQLVVLDEMHRLPSLFPILRGIIDDYRALGARTGHFLILGSASLDLVEQSGESLAGRVRLRELSGIDATEFKDTDLLWLRGGFPDSLDALTERASYLWRQDFIQSYLVRDVPMFAPRLPAPTIERLWVMLAHGQGMVLNKSRLAGSLGVSSTALTRYLDLLTSLQLVRQLPPWVGNVGKRLVRSPKVYVRDSGIVHALLSLSGSAEVLSHPVAGHSYEGWVIEQILGMELDAISSYYRTQAGAEVDLVLERGGCVDTLVEVKRSSAPSVGKGLHSAIRDLRPRRTFVVYPGKERFTLSPGVEAISLPELLTLL